MAWGAVFPGPPGTLMEASHQFLCGATMTAATLDEAMHRRLLIPALVLLAAACGDRTGLLVDLVDGGDHGDGATHDGQGSNDGSSGPINCALHAGPVDSCDAGAGGPVLRCHSGWTCEYSLARDGLWGCCNHPLTTCGYADPPIQGCP